MLKYLKKFDAHTDYTTYINGSDKVLPNVSYCVNENEVHYNPYTDPRLIIKYMVEDDSEPTMIYGGMEYDETSVFDNYSKIEMDGNEISLADLDENIGLYQLSEGEHVAKFTLLNSDKIGDTTFYNCASITSVEIPNSVTTIGEMAFEDCANLTTVTIPDGVTTIESKAFRACTKLKKIKIPNSDSRNNCNAIIVTSTNTLIQGCQNTVIPNTVTTIGGNAFGNCTGLTSISIPDSVTTIEQSAFVGCDNVTTITIPNSVTSIGSYAFGGCDGITSVTIGSGVTSINSIAFQNIQETTAMP